MSSKKHSMAMAFIYMSWKFLEGHDITPEELADHMEESFKKASGELDREELMEYMEKGIVVRMSRPSDLWLAAIRIIRSRTEYF